MRSRKPGTRPKSGSIQEALLMGKYILNQETQKIELHFEKSVYLALSAELKKEINSAFYGRVRPAQGYPGVLTITTGP